MENLQDEIYTVDADDFCDENSAFEVLNSIKERNPAFKITLFAIPARCSLSLIAECNGLDWIELVPHGWEHPHARECENWSYERSIQYLDDIDHFGLVRGFKAPGWQISDGMYQALLERGYWVADQEYNDERRPKELPVYLLNAPERLHYHIGHMGGHNPNEITPYAEFLANLKGEFRFVSETI